MSCRFISTALFLCIRTATNEAVVVFVRHVMSTRCRALLKQHNSEVREKQRAVTLAQQAVEKDMKKKEELQGQKAAAQSAVNRAKEKLSMLKKEGKGKSVSAFRHA